MKRKRKRLTAKQKVEQRLQRQAYARDYNYGLSTLQFVELLEKQGNRCLVCLDEFGDGKTPVVDHDHATGLVRGLLHNRCNLLLSYARDSVDVFRNAIDYLNRTEVRCEKVQ